jgi:hypothetical protein
MSTQPLTENPLDLLPKPPEDGYDWNRFFEDQSVRPYIHHGTSSIFADSIKRYGVSYKRLPYDLQDIERVVRLFDNHNLPGPNGYVGLLRAYALGSSRNSRSLGFTFDWYRAARYALYKCGETFDHLLQVLRWGLEEKRASFSSEEIDFLTAMERRVASMAAGHRPLIISADFRPEWFHGTSFFTDREAFRDKNDAKFRDFLVNSFRVGEFVTKTDIPPEAIRVMTTWDMDHETAIRVSKAI